MKHKNILKKDMGIILAIAILLFICMIVIVAIKLFEKPTNEVVMLEKKVISKKTDSEQLKMQEADNKKQEEIIEEEQNEAEKDYYIKVNYQMNTVTIYTKDKNGNYTIPKKVFICSCGEDTPTSGVYSTSNKYKWRALVDNVYGQYATRIVGSILFHSVPYEKMYDKSSLEYWEYDKLGQAASAGCVRLKVADAKWIYDNCRKGTQVEFYASQDPGPLGKPKIEKISDKYNLRNWDPTDVDENNPWLNTNEN